MQEDQKTDDYLRGLGMEVVRYSNIDVLQNEDGVVDDISERLRTRIGKDVDPL